MNRMIDWWRRVGALVAFAMTALAVPTPTVSAAPAPSEPGREATAFDVTARDVEMSNAKVRMAYAHLVEMWREQFAEVGVPFAQPRLVRYRGAIRTACGVVTPSNASYCPPINTIYYDEVFVAAQAKAAGRELGTDGDMAAVGVIAHEMGHAVAIQLGLDSRIPYEHESTADCLAGAFARHAGDTGALEEGDIEEAFFGMAAAADPTPELTGDRRIDRRILTRAAVLGHGTRAQRMDNFRAGLDAGPRACMSTFAAIG